MANEQDRARQQEIEKLFHRNFYELRDLAFEDPRLLVGDVDNVVEDVARHLDDYNGLLTDAAFLPWASGIVKSEATRISKFYELRSQYERYVLGAVWGVMRKAGDLSDDDPVRTARTLADETWQWAFENLDSLLTPGKARISTRLHAKAFWIARAWKTARLRERAKTADLDVACIGKDPSTADEDAVFVYVEPDWEREELEAV